jgi:hypothetical protein
MVCTPKHTTLVPMLTSSEDCDQNRLKEGLTGVSDMNRRRSLKYARVQLTEGGRMAILEQDPARLWYGIASPPEAGFGVMDAEPLSSSPSPRGQDPNVDIQKLAIHIDRILPSVAFTLGVGMIPLSPGQEPPTEPPAVTPLAKW